MKRLTLICILLMCCSNSFADNLYVPSVDYPTIQSAINDANDGDMVIVSPDRYKENINFSGRAITVTSIDPNDPNVVAVTIIDGNEPADANFASVVTFNSGEDNNSVLTGFTITGGSGSWLSISWEFKGLRWSLCGGGAVCYNMSAPTICNNIFTDNIACEGGGIFIYGNPVNPNNPSNPPIHISPLIKNNIFIDNNSVIDGAYVPPDSNYPENNKGDGAAIASFQGCDAIITNNVFYENAAHAYGGAIHLMQWSDGLIEDNHILNNKAALGGGIHITYDSCPTITGNTINFNRANTFGGGGIYVYYHSHPVISNNIITNNTCLSSRGGGIGAFYDSNPTIVSNIIANNSALWGGGVFLLSEEAVLSYNTIAKNSSLRGSGLYVTADTQLLATGNIIALNTDSAQIYLEPDSILTSSYNDIWGTTENNYEGSLSGLTVVDGNISTDPNFASADNNDFSLTLYSPCINAGDPNFIMGTNQVDIDGDPRILGQYVDMGADEVWPVWNISRQKQYLSIQEAINDSFDVDTIMVARGRYYETISFGIHQIALTSADPDDWNVVENTIIDANHTGTAVVISGGQDDNTVFKGFTVTNGNAQNGHAGGVWCYASPIIEQNIIRNNYAYYKGGGMYFWKSSARPLVIDNKIIDNEAVFGGGVFCDTASRAILENNLIAGNEGTTAAGGICCSLVNETVIVNNQIIANKSQNGAGLYSFSNNDVMQIINNLFCGNSAVNNGGAILLVMSDPNIINNTLAANRSSTGSGLYLETSSFPLLANNIIAFSDYGEGIYCVPDVNYPSEPNLLNNNVYGNTEGNYAGSLGDQTGTNSNISIDPNLVDVGSWDDANTPEDANDDFFVEGDYHLMSISACINAGDNNSVPVWLSGDIDAEQRISNGIVDIGADEFINPYDLNGDGIVDYYELSLLTGEWLTTGPGLQTDFYNDDFIDFLDLAVLAEQWMFRYSSQD